MRTTNPAVTANEFSLIESVPASGPKITLPDVDRRHAPTYSRFVNLMKLFLPSLAVLMIVIIAVWPYLKGKDARFQIGFSALKMGESEDPSMVNPRYIGTDNNRQTYSVTADLAKNLLQGDSAVVLEMPKADITMEDGSWVVLTADTGIYGRRAKTLDLAGAVNMFHDSGYEFRTAKAHVDLVKGIASSTDPVQGQGPFGNLKAEGFRLIKSSQTIHFTGKSKLIFYPGLGNAEQ